MKGRNQQAKLRTHRKLKSRKVAAPVLSSLTGTKFSLIKTIKSLAAKLGLSMAAVSSVDSRDSTFIVSG